MPTRPRSKCSGPSRKLRPTRRQCQNSVECVYVTATSKSGKKYGYCRKGVGGTWTLMQGKFGGRYYVAKSGRKVYVTSRIPATIGGMSNRTAQKELLAKVKYGKLTLPASGVYALRSTSKKVNAVYTISFWRDAVRKMLGRRSARFKPSWFQDRKKNWRELARRIHVTPLKVFKDRKVNWKQLLFWDV